MEEAVKSLRRYKINKALGKPIDKNFEGVYIKIRDNITHLNNYKYNTDSNIILYGEKGNDILMVRDILKNTFHICFKKFGDLFSNDESFNPFFVSYLITNIIVNHYNLNDLKPKVIMDYLNINKKYY